MLSIVLLLFLVMGAASATDAMNVSKTEDSNLIDDNVHTLSTQNKLEISNEDSISETNIVNSHDDNLESYDNDTLNVSEDCDDQPYEVVDTEGDDAAISASSSIDNVVSVESSDNSYVSAASTSAVKSVSPTATKLVVSDTHYSKSGTVFGVTLKDKSGKALSNLKVSLKVKGKIYSGYTNKNGVASIKTASLAVGTYTVTVSYDGNSNYSASSLSKKVKVLSSINAKDLTKKAGSKVTYAATFWRDGSVLSNTKVSFKVNGKTYTRKTNSNGVASLSLNLAKGKHEIHIINPYSKEEVSHKIIIKKAKTSLSAKSKTYIHPKKKGSFTVTLKSDGKLLKNRKITFNFNHKKVTSKTDANGKATITIPVLAKGTHKISFKYKGSDVYSASSGNAKLVVKNPTTKLSSSIMVTDYNSGSKFKVKLTNDNGKVLANKTVKFKVNGKTILSKTNRNGNAKLSLKDMTPGNYVVKYSYSTKGSKDYNHGSNRVIVLKVDAKVSAGNLTMKVNDGTYYKVTVKDKSGNRLGNITVKSTIGGKSYLYKTDSNGVAKIKVKNGVGIYNVKSFLADPCYKSKVISKSIVVKGYKFVYDRGYASAGNNAAYSVKLVNEKNKPVSDKTVVFTFKGKNLTGKTNSNGIAKVKLGKLSKGTHKIKFTQGSASGTSEICVVGKISIKNILAASKKVKSYISKHSKLPSTVKVGSVSFKTADYLYLASKAIINLKAGNKKAIAAKIVSNPTKAMAAHNLGYLKGYLGVAKSIVKTAKSKGKMPNSVSSRIGSIGYKGLVYAFSKVLTSYSNKGKMPSYVAVKSLSQSTSSSTGALNFKNKITNLAAYLAASHNCDVNNPKIKKLVAKLTKNCKTDKQKATAIYNYVRDTISYSFYYDTRYGAVGTLNARTGNCVDHSHLLAAMFRSAGLATRYVHGTCSFSSGTYGHVWTQVLIGNTWTVADATSSRNSLGKVVNWNSHSYSLKGYHSSILF